MQISCGFTLIEIIWSLLRAELILLFADVEQDRHIGTQVMNGRQ